METEKRLRKKCFSNLQIEDSTCLFANNCAELARNQLISDIQFCVLRKVKLSAMKSVMASLNHAPPGTHDANLLLLTVAGVVGIWLPGFQVPIQPAG